MLTRSAILFFLLLLVSGCNNTGIKQSAFNLQEHAFLAAKDSTTAVILCHGRGKHPRWKVVEPLRKGIHQQLNVHTLSLQMPTDANHWEDYQYLFPQAFQSIDQSIKYLQENHAVTKIYLVGHSMGSRMASAYIASKPKQDIAGFIGIGMRNNGGAPLNAKYNLQKTDIPVLDLFGDGGNAKDAQHARSRTTLISGRYTQILIPGANHRFSGYEKEMIQAVTSWINSN